MIDILSRQLAIKANAAANAAASQAASASSSTGVNASAVATEVTNRMAAVTSEANARAAAITAEASARATADTTNANAITSEATRANAAEGAITAALTVAQSGASSVAIAASYQTLFTTGYATAGDGGHGLYKRVAAQPAATLGQMRTSDRYLPSGATDATNGGWWQLLPENGEVNILQLGAVGDCVSGATGAVSSGATAFAAAGAGFTSASVGKTIAIAGAGASGATLVTTIAAVSSSTAATLATAASTTVSGANFSYGTNNLGAFQSAYNALAAGTFSSLVVPDGKFLLNGAITLSQTVMAGWHVRHSSIGATTLLQAADNTPFYSFTMDLMNSCIWEGGSYQWVGSQTGNQSAAVFYWFAITGYTSRSIFQCRFGNFNVVNGYWTFRSETALFWGNRVEQVWHNTSGGFAYISGTQGNPRNVFDTVYIKGGAAGEYLFKAAACANFYEHVEVNSSPSGFLIDGSGGTHQGRQVAMEVMNFTTNTIMFNNVNGFMQFDSVYIQTMTLAAGVTVTAFVDSNNSNGSVTDIALFSWAFSGAGITAQGAGSAFYVYGGNSLKKSRIRHLLTGAAGQFSAQGASPVSALTNMGAQAAADSVTIDDWTDSTRVQMAPASGTLTVALGSARNIVVGTALTGTLSIVLPYSGSGSGNNWFTGLTFDVIKLASAGTTYAINIYYSDGVTLFGTIPAATASGKYSVMFTRTNPAGTGGICVLTHVPAGV